MDDASLAITMPGSNLWGQSFMKKHENVPTNAGGNGGEYTYTSEL